MTKESSVPRGDIGVREIESSVPRRSGYRRQGDIGVRGDIGVSQGDRGARGDIGVREI